MQQEDVLLTLGEIAVTLAALSGVAGVFGTRSGDADLSDFDILLLRNVALIGMGVAALALLPLAMRGATLDDFAVLRLCSAVGACAWFAGYAFTLRRVLSALRSRELPVGSFILGLALNAATVILLAWNTVAPDPNAPQRYVLALMAALGIAGINFIVTVLRTRTPAA